MEDIYTVKVKTRPDPRGLYPSERRYSASTVAGLAWVHLALGCTCFLLTCLTLVNTGNKVASTDLISISNTSVAEESVNTTNFLPQANVTNGEPSEVSRNVLYARILISAPSMLTVAAAISAVFSFLASTKWYVDQNIMWLFAASVIGTTLAILGLGLVIAWIGFVSEQAYETESPKNVELENLPFSDYEVHTENSALFYVIKVPVNYTLAPKEKVRQSFGNQPFTKKVLSINILIAAILEILWSVLSLKISWKGMRKNYPEDDNLEQPNGNCVEVITKIKGNNTKRLPRNTKMIPPKPDLINHYPRNNKAMKKIYVVQDANGNERGKENSSKASSHMEFPPKESSSEYRERMFNFLNKCVAYRNSGEFNINQATPSVNSDASRLHTVTPILEENPPNVDSDPNVSPSAANSNPDRLSWGDPHDYPIYDQNTLDLDKIIQMKINHTNEIKKNDKVTEENVQAIKESEPCESSSSHSPDETQRTEL